mmetsp:Transcript_24933/g.83158  ORF Transcript_24933/g.83158 Transcript_24933/m.83158 type:complete len:218 (+) Transcript_24933:275-928(+)
MSMSSSSKSSIRTQGTSFSAPVAVDLSPNHACLRSMSKPLAAMLLRKRSTTCATGSTAKPRNGRDSPSAAEAQSRQSPMCGPASTRHSGRRDEAADDDDEPRAEASAAEASAARRKTSSWNSCKQYALCVPRIRFEIRPSDLTRCGNTYIQKGFPPDVAETLTTSVALSLSKKRHIGQRDVSKSQERFWRSIRSTRATIAGVSVSDGWLASEAAEYL